jgi:hypothetical protein
MVVALPEMQKELTKRLIILPKRWVPPPVVLVSVSQLVSTACLRVSNIVSVMLRVHALPAC